MNELRAYADGHWAAWHGLDRCPLDRADDELGPRRPEGLHSGVFGGEPTQFALYPGGDASPDGLTVWVLGDVLVGLEMRTPTPPPAVLEDLAAPPAVIASELGPDWDQELWPERGLVLHRRGALIAVALGLAPFTVEAWESDPLRRWRIERRSDR